MTIEHVMFIPAVLLTGMALGYMLGARAAREELARKQAVRKK